MQHDRLADALSIVKNAEKVGKRECAVPRSKLVERVLSIIREEDYIGEVEVLGKNKIRVKLLGKINDCNVVKPRFSSTKNEFEKWEMRYLPSRGFGILIISTSSGILTHEEAEEKGIGGKLLAYVY